MYPSRERTAAEWYSAGRAKRMFYVLRTLDQAKYIDPHLFPTITETTDTSSYDLRTPFQSTGAIIMDAAASMFMNAALPLQTSYVKLLTDPFYLEQKGADPASVAQLNAALMVFERAILNEVDQLAIRPVFHSALKHWYLGNVLFYFDYKTGDCKYYKINQYVVFRDGVGNVTRIVTFERISPDVLEGEARKIALKDAKEGSWPADVDLYTMVERIPGTGRPKFRYWQEICGKKIEESEGEEFGDVMPWMPMRYSWISGESYGRGGPEIYLGNLKSAEGLRTLTLQGGAAAAKMIFLVDESMGVYVRDVISSDNCAVLAGREGAITVAQPNNMMNLQFAAQESERLERECKQRGMIWEPRDSERTPLGESQMTRYDMDPSRTGSFASLQKEFTEPFLNRIIRRLKRKKRWPANVPVPGGGENDFIVPKVRTGLDVIGRNQEVEQMERWIAAANATLQGPLVQILKSRSSFAAAQANLYGVDPMLYGGIKDDETLQSEEQAAQQQAMMARVPQEVAKGAANIIAKRVPEAAPETAEQQ